MFSADPTVVAALVAAGVSTVTLVVTAAVGLRSETRAAHRQVLQPYLPALASGLAQAMATATMLYVAQTKNQSAVQARNWRTKGNEAAQSIKEVRHQVRYPLYGLDEGLRTLSRVPHWIANYRGVKAARGAQLLAEGDRLRVLLDRVISRSYRRGRPPSRLERYVVARQAERVRELWRGDFGGKVSAEDIAGEDIATEAEA